MPSRKFSKRERVTVNASEADLSPDKELEIITKFFWFSGIAFYPFDTFLSLKGFLVTCLDVGVSVLSIYFLAATVHFTATLSSHATGHAFISTFANIIGLCIRFIVLKKRRRIRKCSEIISKLNQDMMLAPDTKRTRRFLWIACGLSVLLPVSMMVFSLITDDTACDILASNQRLAVEMSPLLTMILCVFVFTRLRDINRNFLAQLQSSMDMNMPTKLFTDYTKLYGRITKTVEKVEKTFSLISFFLYGYMLSCVFSITSYMITRLPGSSYASGILFQAATFIEIVACFIFLSIRAANVNESAVEVKNLIHSLPAKRFDFNPNLTATLLQLANNFASEVCVTGWGLFMINRGFILTTAGVVVTYGVILVQLGS
ncbi:uncharacterized protein CDAR_186581 [Caerostris darwini]|uniref:Gustatory receptor n=1 Tax=Caerostris darwini TaxID=1538125 RepID=A0AAV4VUI7_9ARAC|nr:uncharacterized protein CDAR_186581 [Caerostris darwini]